MYTRPRDDDLLLRLIMLPSLLLYYCDCRFAVFELNRFTVLAAS